MLYVARRRVAEEPISRLAIWSRRIALFSSRWRCSPSSSCVGRARYRAGARHAGGALVLAVVAILLAFGAASSSGSRARRPRPSGRGLLIGVALIAYPVYLGVKAYRLPAIYDITTDPIDPPRFEAIARLRPRDANPVAYAGPLRRRAAARRLSRHRAARRRLRRRRKPTTRRSRSSPSASGASSMRARRRRAGRAATATHRGGGAHADPRLPRRRRGARARRPSDGTRIDVRSASRYGRHDLGTNARACRAPDRRHRRRARRAEKPKPRAGAGRISRRPRAVSPAKR